ncbi:hypothetical protein DOK78_000470 [Enterococcus sp. DIV2402]|uniref:Uncharacterized protein n=1 Tax=Candidatus Enterococcus lowellii TaxID=2230877 RepID=A0ABZ2SK71_9ENTE|nr:hypothetical protein [Enterococcus sp. DIV2402]MBO0465216.1 hypothetical protein [Enterococcus sp. DIV2402]
MSYKKKKNIFILYIFYLMAQLISNGIDGNWSFIYLIKENGSDILGFMIGIFLFFYLDND